MSKMTWKQKDYLNSLIDRLSPYSWMQEEIGNVKVDNLSVKEASELISRLQEEVCFDDPEGWDGHKY